MVGHTRTQPDMFWHISLSLGAPFTHCEKAGENRGTHHFRAPEKTPFSNGFCIHRPKNIFGTSSPPSCSSHTASSPATATQGSSRACGHVSHRRRRTRLWRAAASSRTCKLFPWLSHRANFSLTTRAAGLSGGAVRRPPAGALWLEPLPHAPPWASCCSSTTRRRRSTCLSG
jgi:hypothetical protein